MDNGRYIRLLRRGSMVCLFAIFSSASFADHIYASVEEAKASTIWDCYQYDSKMFPFVSHFQGCPSTYEGSKQAGIDAVNNLVSKLVAENPGAICDPIESFYDDTILLSDVVIPIHNTGLTEIGDLHLVRGFIQGGCSWYFPPSGNWTGQQLAVWMTEIFQPRPPIEKNDRAGVSFFVLKQKQNTIKLSNDANPPTSGDLAEVEPAKSINTLRATVYDSNNQPQSGISVTLRADVVPLSGGHSHNDDNRPKGNLGGPPPIEHILERQVTGPDGAVHFTF